MQKCVENQREIKIFIKKHCLIFFYESARVYKGINFICNGLER